VAHYEQYCQHVVTALFNCNNLEQHGWQLVRSWPHSIVHACMSISTWNNLCVFSRVLLLYFQILLFLGGGNSALNFGAGLAQIQLWTTSPDRQLLFHSFFVRIFVKYFQNVFLLFFAF
jgi:hypothetical protein